MRHQEYKQRCDCCKEKVEARIFYKKIGGKDVWLCKVCWEKF